MCTPYGWRWKKQTKKGRAGVWVRTCWQQAEHMLLPDCWEAGEDICLLGRKCGQMLGNDATLPGAEEGGHWLPRQQHIYLHAKE